ncbi:MAG: methyltransferase [Paludibacteraceae bacterium]|nr:methyltransferase [Paludibacteraceae bacterium]
MNPGFQFKQFYVRHERCAMKVGTDGVLLGAWTPIMEEWRMADGGNTRVLDVGTGSGLVALMLAQRLPQAQIDAIDIDASAVEQAGENFASSPWPDRLQACLSPLQTWQTSKYENEKISKCYSLIVSNPPYFQHSLKNPDKGRELARHTDSLSYEELIHHSARLLRNDGILALILPAGAEKEICALARTEGLTPTHLTRVYSKASKPVRRVLIAFVMSSCPHNVMSSCRHDEITSLENSLILENETGGRSAAYQQLTKDFYL